jgi:hypothetical protein
MLSVIIMNVTFCCRDADCRYAECRYVECRGTLFDQLVFCWLILNQIIKLIPFMNLLNLP